MLIIGNRKTVWAYYQMSTTDLPLQYAQLRWQLSSHLPPHAPEHEKLDTSHLKTQLAYKNDNAVQVEVETHAVEAN